MFLVLPALPAPERTHPERVEIEERADCATFARHEVVARRYETKRIAQGPTRTPSDPRRARARAA